MKQLLVFFVVLCSLMTFSYQESVATQTHEEEMVIKKKAKKKSLTAPTKSGRLTKTEYAKALQHPKWQKKRLRTMNRDKWKCRGCGDTETTLHIHHLRYTTKYPWNELMKNLITYCKRCHAKAHGKKEVVR